MILPDDDINCNIMENIKLYETTKICTFVPIKPVICTFFKPKIKAPNHIYLSQLKESIKIPTEIKNILDNDENNSDYKLIRLQDNLRSNKLAKLRSNSLRKDLIKLETLIKPEDSCQTFSRTESSSTLSNLPNISIACSKSLKSLSDSDNQDPIENEAMSLIVKNVYSLCKSNKSIKDEIKNPISLVTCSNPIVITKEFLPRKSTRKSSVNPSNRKPKSNRTKKISVKINKSKKRSKQKVNVNKMNPEISDVETEAMTLDIDDFDLQIEENTLKYNLMQPVILLKRLEFNQIIPEFDNIQITPNKSITDYEYQTLSKHSDNSLNKADRKNIFCSDEGKSAKIQKLVLPTENLINNEKSPLDKLIHHSMINSVDNEFLYCFLCNKSSIIMCNIHPVQWIFNKNIDCPHVEYLIDESFDKYIDNSEEKSYCNCQRNELEHIQINLPSMFQLKESHNSEIGVWTKRKLKLGSIIGPYLGEIFVKTPLENSPYYTRRCTKLGFTNELHCLQFAFKSNWLQCINVTNNQQKANLKILKYYGKVFFQAFKEIDSTSELLLCSKFDYKLYEMRNDPNFRQISFMSESNLLIDSENNSITKNPIVPQAIYLAEKSMKNISYKSWKYQKSILEKIAKLCHGHSHLNSSEIVRILRCQYPELEDNNDKTLPFPISRSHRYYRLRIDNEIIEFIINLFHSNPAIKFSQIFMLIRQKFLNKGQFNRLHTNQLIRRPKLRGIDNNLDEETVQAVIEMFTENNRLMLKDVQKKLISRFPMKLELGYQTISKIINNYRFKGNRENKYRIDQEMLKEIEKLINKDKFISQKKIYWKLKEQFPKKRNVKLNYICFLMKKFNFQYKLNPENVIVK